MVKRIGSLQRKTRHKFLKPYRTKGKIPVNRYLQQLQAGDSVNLKIEPMVQTGRFFRRFHGMTGRVTGRRGLCYEIEIRDGEKRKTLYVHPVHLHKQ